MLPIEWRATVATRPSRDLTGQVINGVHVIRREATTKRGQSLWLVRLPNGAEKVNRIDRIAVATSRRMHGMSRSSEYNIWRGMIARCKNEKNPAFKYYGARGIKVCRAWVESFDVFYADMGSRPDGRSIDRINNDGDYEPGNCRWATPAEQVANRRKI